MIALEQQITYANEAIKKLLVTGESVGKGTSKAGTGRRISGQKVLDTKTNKVYISLSKAGKELASEIKGKRLGHDWVVISLNYKRKRKPKKQAA